MASEKMKLWVKLTDSQPMKIEIEKSSDISDVIDQAVKKMNSLNGVTNEMVAVKCGGSCIEKDQLVSSTISEHHCDSVKNALVLHVIRPAGLSSSASDVIETNVYNVETKAADGLLGNDVSTDEEKQEKSHMELLNDLICSRCSKRVSHGENEICARCRIKIICYRCVCKGDHPGNPVCDDCILIQKDQLWLFLDNSNLWIESKKLRAKKMGLVTTEDHRLRIDFRELITCIQKLSKGNVAECYFYGSKPPPQNEIWQMAEQQGWKLSIKDKGSNGKEKEVDTEIVADVTALANNKVGGKIILITGDRDMCPCIRKAQTLNWKVEVYMWKHAASNEFDQMGIFYGLDDEFENITFIEWECKEDQAVKKGFGIEIAVADEKKLNFYLQIEQLIKQPLQYKNDRNYHNMWQVVFQRKCNNEVVTAAKSEIEKKMDVKTYTLKEYEETLCDMKQGYTQKHSKGWRKRY